MEYRLRSLGFMDFFAKQKTLWNPGLAVYRPWIKYIYIEYIFFYYYYNKIALS